MAPVTSVLNARRDDGSGMHQRSRAQTVANLGQFVFWNARTKVLDCNGYYALPTPQITADGSVGQRMQDCIFK